jgi:lactate racemase
MTAMQTRFAFGKHGLTLTLPEDPRVVYEEVRGRAAPPLADPIAAICQALDQPLAGPALGVLAEGKRTAAISVCDITRPAPNSLTLPPLLARLHAAGIPRDGVTILIATGLHRPATSAELRIILGPEIAAAYRILNHDARNPSEHRDLGPTARGTPVSINARFLAADLHITLGFIEQHLMLGFSGGRKLVAPGLAGEATIKTIHSPRFMREPLATEGCYSENPLHAELLEIARMARHDFLLDVTLTPARKITGVFAGEPVAAHAAGVDHLRRTSLETLSGPADAVITSAAGFPLDLNLYQMVKGVTAAAHIVKQGGPGVKQGAPAGRGRILILGECSEGAGSSEFTAKLASLRTYPQFLEELRLGPVAIDQWQLEKLALTGLACDLFFYIPGVPRAALAGLAPYTYATAEAAVAAVLHGLPPNARVALIPEGPYVFARVAPDA